MKDKDCKSSKDSTYQVRVQFDARDNGGQLFGPFNKSETAEECIIALSTRIDVISAQTEENTHGDV